MGCDIHLFIEHSHGNHPVDKTPYWWNFGQQIYPGRDYRMFAILAGVRDYNSGTVPTVAPRGLPDPAKDGRIASDTFSEAYLHVTNLPTLQGHEDYCSVEQAERWTASGASEWIGDKRGDGGVITHPDWHSHSWMTLDEWKTSIARYGGGDPFPLGVQYHAVTAVLEELQKRGEQVRVVFWFDN